MVSISRLRPITRYFGFAVIGIEWLLLLSCIVLIMPNFNEPFSQYGTYPETKLVFGSFFTLASVLYYLFARNLDPYWSYTSKLAIIAGIAFVVTGWAPYQPYANKFVLDVHNVALVIAILGFTMPMLFIGFTRKHERIAKASKIGFISSFLITILSLVARVIDTGVIYSQMATLLIFHAWLATVNILLLQHHKANSHKL